MSAPPANLSQRLNASQFPQKTPLRAFFEWNEARRNPDRRYVVACDLYSLLNGCGSETCLAHLLGQLPGLRRVGATIAVPRGASERARRAVAEAAGSPASAAARRLIEALSTAIGSSETALHAALFQSFEALSAHIDLAAVARLRPQRRKAASGIRHGNILIIKLGALGDFIQALGPVPAIRRYHSQARLCLLTTRRYVEIAQQSGLFDKILVDRRPRGLDLPGWLALRRMLRTECFDRVYDFQTSDRSNAYFSLMRPGRRPEWSGTAWRCSHPHANLARNAQHTMDRQAEQLMMAGIYPVATTPWLPAAGALPPELAGRRFALLIPGSSPSRPAKRWPAGSYGGLALRLAHAGYRPVVIGVAAEEPLGRAIRSACPEALDLVGRTDVAGLCALARAAALTIGNDTGATHVAAAGGNPVLVLFSRESSPGLCAPRGSVVRVLVEPNLADLSIEAVFAAAKSVAEVVVPAPAAP